MYYADINLDLEKQQDGDIKKDVDIEAVKNSMYNISLTIQGYRPMIPEFAYNGYNLLFEPITKENGNIIGNILWQSIEKWDNRVRIDRMHVELNPEESNYIIYIYFYIINVISETEPELLRLVMNQL